MATISAKRIKDALKKVQRVGRIEETATIAGCNLTLQNLSPPEFESALLAIQDLEDVAYAHAYQLEQVARAIVQIDEQDLRDADYIEDEVPTGQYVLELLLPNKAAAEAVATKLREQKLSPTVTQQTDGGTKTVKLERHQWLKENVLKDWSREALTVAWRKFTETLIKADENAKKGVTFLVPDETPEDKYRRLLNDLKEMEDDLPDDMINRALDEAGFMKKTTRDVLDAMSDRLAKMGEKAPDGGGQQAEAAPPVPVAAPVPAPPAGPPVAPSEPPEAIQAAMAARSRLNQSGAELPVPPTPSEPPTVTASRRVQVPEQIRRAAMQNTQGMQGPQTVPQVVRGPQPGEGQGISTRRQNRANEIAALEGEIDPGMSDGATGPSPFQPGPQVAELSHKTPPIDAQGVRTILDRPPVVGVNPKYRPRGA